MRIWRVSFNSVRGSLQIVNTLHYITEPETIDDESSGDDVASKINTELTTNYRNICDTGTTLQSIVARQEVQPGSGDVPTEGSYAVGLAGTRTLSGRLLPQPTCVELQHLTGAAVRGGQGRMFLPPTYDTNAATSGGLVDMASTYVSFVLALKTSLAEAQNGADWQMGTVNINHMRQIVYSRTRHARGQDPYYFYVTGSVVSPRFHWLRSRVS